MQPYWLVNGLNQTPTHYFSGASAYLIRHRINVGLGAREYQRELLGAFQSDRIVGHNSPRTLVWALYALAVEEIVETEKDDFAGFV